jgi:very-short-patch-repair endonuclease
MDIKITQLLLETELRHKTVCALAKELGTYPNKIRRLAKKYKIDIPDKSEAQSRAIKNGDSEHPTAGKKRDLETRLKISKGNIKVWEGDENRKSELIERTKKIWEEKTPEEKYFMAKQVSRGLLKAAKNGSKLENFLFDSLIKEGFRAEPHVTLLLKNEKMHVDILLPEKRIAIEVDGPTHFESIFGEEKLRQIQKSDTQKNGLLLQNGYAIIRVQQKSKLTLNYMTTLAKKLIDTINSITPENRFIVL